MEGLFGMIQYSTCIYIRSTNTYVEYRLGFSESLEASDVISLTSGEKWKSSQTNNIDISKISPKPLQKKFLLEI